jgi:hypothetical protein
LYAAITILTLNVLTTMQTEDFYFSHRMNNLVRCLLRFRLVAMPVSETKWAISDTLKIQTIG